MKTHRFIAWAMLMFVAAPVRAQSATPLVREQRDSLEIRMVDVDIRAALQALGRYLDHPILFGSLPATRVSLETPRPIARSQVLGMVRSLVEAQNLEMQLDSTSGMYRIRTRVASPPSISAAPPRGAPTQPTALATSSGGLELFVIALRHARAADVAAGVNALYGRASALGELGAPSRPTSATLEQGIRQNAIVPQEPANAAAGRRTSAGVAVTQNAVLSGEVTIVPDARTNSLLVRSTRRDYELVNAAVTQLDVRPLQVLIEVLIAEVRRDRMLAYGLASEVGQTALPGAGGGTLGGQVSADSPGDFLLRLLDLRIGTAQLNATLRAAASRGDVHIVSRPVLIAANNELAEILVGSQRPFVQVQRSLPTDAPSRDQVVQYRDVGTRLSVRPTISADGYVMIAVTQEVNAATNETAFDAPVISTRSVQTQLLIKDQQTVVLGGLIDQQRDNTQSGIPLLSSIPFVGGLFGRVNRRTTETELFVFLTPRIIRDDESAEALTLPLRERAKIRK